MREFAMAALRLVAGLVLLVVLAFAVGLLAGCGGGGSPDSPDSPERNTLPVGCLSAECAR